MRDELGVPFGVLLSPGVVVLILVRIVGPALLVLGRTPLCVVGVLCLFRAEFWKSAR